MSKRVDFFLTGLNILSWIIFIGLCIESGGLVFNAIISIFINSKASSNFWGGINLYELYKFNQSHFITLVALLIIISLQKSMLFYMIVNLFHNKKLNFSSPFNESLGKRIFYLSYLSIGIGLFTYLGNRFSNWLSIVSSGEVSLSAQNIKFEGADVWLFMGVILITFAMIFKKGIELQSENDLTV